jgi:hypothetical protein
MHDLRDALESNNVESVMMIHVSGLLNMVSGNGEMSFLQSAVANQATDSVEYIVIQPDIDMNYQNASGNSALHIATATQNVKICDLLLKHGIDPNLRSAYNGETALYRQIRNALETGQNINKDIFNMLINHPKFDISIMSRYENGDQMNLLDLIVEAILNKRPYSSKAEKSILTKKKDDIYSDDELPPLEEVSQLKVEKVARPIIKEKDQEKDQEILYYIGVIMEMYNKSGIKIELENVYKKIFESCSNCGKIACFHDGRSNLRLENRIELLEIMFKINIVPEKIDDEILYTWVLGKIDQWNQNDRLKILETMNKVFVDRSKLYQERPESECSILEEILRNGDIDQINNSEKYDYGRRCKKHKCTPFGRWLSELGPVQDLKRLEDTIKAYGKACNGNIHYYANGVNWQSLNFLKDTNSSQRVVEAYKIMLKCGFPLPNMIEGYNLPEDRVKIINNYRKSKLISYYQIKETILHQSKKSLSMMVGTVEINKLIINDLELIDLEPVEEIDSFNFILMSNGVAWDIKNLVNYIMYTTDGKNLYDAKTKHVELIGQPIWSDEDMEYLKMLSNPDENHESGASIRKLLEYINSEQYRNAFTVNEREEIRRFGSIFGSTGAWWEYELKKVTSTELYNEWLSKKSKQDNSSMPSLSDELYKICVTLKGKYLLLYKDFLGEMTVTKKKALVWLNSNMTESYQKDVIRGQSCIMSFSSRLKSINEKFGLSINEMNKSLVKEYLVIENVDKAQESDEINKQELLIQMFPSKLTGKNIHYEM